MSKIVFIVENGKIRMEVEGKIKVSELMSIANYIQQVVANIEISGEPDKPDKAGSESSNKSVTDNQ